jgi:SsrA-binding protein
MPSQDDAFRRLISHRKALHDYQVLDRIEAGLELVGTEVKSLRQAQGSLVGAYCQIERGEAFVLGMEIPAYECGNRFNHAPKRRRRLLLHKREILRLAAHSEQQGHTLIPLSVYIKKGRVKLEVGVCRGKRQTDKRETLKRQTAQREADRAIADHRRQRA